MSLCLTQLQKRLESVLNFIRIVAKNEETSPITIVSLAMQLLANGVNISLNLSYMMEILEEKLWNVFQLTILYFLIDLLDIRRR